MKRNSGTRTPNSSTAGPVARSRLTSVKESHREYASGNTTTRKIPARAGSTSRNANQPSDSRIDTRPARAPFATGSAPSTLVSPFVALRQRLLEGHQLLEPLGDRRRAADDVVHGRHRLGVVLAVPGLFVGGDDLAFLVLLAQELEVDPLVVGRDDLRVVVHLRIGIVEAGDQTPLALHVPVAVEIAAQEARQLPRILEILRLGVDHV